jgi:hypothetical protein
MHHFSIPFCILALVAGAFAQDSSEAPQKEVQDTTQQEPADVPEFIPPPHLRDGASGSGGVKRLRPQSSRERHGVARSALRKWRNPSSEDLDRFILVAGELKPEWGSSLQSLRDTDQAQFQKAVSSSRRLWHLVELHQRNPNLYTLRLEELRNGEQLRALGRAYREAMEAGNSPDAERLLGELRKLSLSHVDLQIRVRGEELAAMSEALEQLRQDMLLELQRREQLADELIEQLLAPREERSKPGESPENPLLPPGAGLAKPPISEET